MFQQGVTLFNRGLHWEAHEVFEDVWRLQEGETKRLAQGFVQIAAAFSYIRKQRYDSILYLFDKSTEKLTTSAHLFPEANIPELIAAMAGAKAEVTRLGEAGLKKFPYSLYPRIVIASHTKSHKRVKRRRNT